MSANFAPLRSVFLSGFFCIGSNKLEPSTRDEAVSHTAGKTSTCTTIFRSCWTPSAYNLFSILPGLTPYFTFASFSFTLSKFLFHLSHLFATCACHHHWRGISRSVANEHLRLLLPIRTSPLRTPYSSFLPGLRLCVVGAVLVLQQVVRIDYLLYGGTDR